MITVDSKPSSKSKAKSTQRKPRINPRTTSKFFFVNQDKTQNAAEYPFFIENTKLETIGKCIASSRRYIPTSFQGSWDNIFKKLDGVRMVDYLDFLVYAVPTIICPVIKNVGARKALFALSKGCSLALQWNISEEMIVTMER